MLKENKKDLIISTLLLFLICSIFASIFFVRLNKIKNNNEEIIRLNNEINNNQKDINNFNNELNELLNQSNVKEYELWLRKTEELKNLISTN